MKKTKEESQANRVFAHYKATKHNSNLKWVVTKRCVHMNNCDSSINFYAHVHGHYETATSNQVWLEIARAHKMSVREVKDIVTAKRGK